MTLQHWNDERLDRLAESVEKVTAEVQSLTTDVQELKAELRSGFAETRSNIAALTRLAQLQQDNMEGMRAQFDATLARMDQAILELRAGQQRQDAILDYLIRRDGQQNPEAQ